MREILFRGKRIDNGEWVEGFYWRSMIKDTEYIIIGNIADMQLYPVIPETVGQFTGLTDKNGKKIFEGDITNAGIEGALARVIYLDGAFQYEYLIKPQKPDIYRFEYHKMNTHEVIGNIHDNLELLKGGQ